jgi:hypothetical protein
MSLRVNFHYDNGDPSVNIPGGWEECYVTDDEEKVFFRPEYGKEPSEWLLEDEHGEAAIRKEGLIETQLTVGMLPKDYREAIEYEWTGMMLRERVDSLEVNLAGVESEIAELHYEREEEYEVRPDNPNPEKLMRIDRQLAALNVLVGYERVSLNKAQSKLIEWSRKGMEPSS